MDLRYYAVKDHADRVLMTAIDFACFGEVDALMNPLDWKDVVPYVVRDKETLAVVGSYAYKLNNVWDWEKGRWAKGKVPLLYIDSICVMPHFRGRSCAGAMLERMRKQFPRLPIVADTRRSNDSMQKVLHKAGMYCVGSITDAYEPGDDALRYV